MAQLQPLPLTFAPVNQIGFTFWYWLTEVVPEKGMLTGVVVVVVIVVL